MPISIDADWVSIFIFVFALFQSILSKVKDFKVNHRDEIDAICIKFKGMLSEKINDYAKLYGQKKSNNEEEEQEREQRLESIINEINQLSNTYYDWSRLIIGISKELRQVFLFGVLAILSSIILLILNNVEVLSFILPVLRGVLGIAYLYILLFSIPTLFKAYYSLPTEIEKRHQEIKEGTFRSWMKV